PILVLPPYSTFHATTTTEIYTLSLHDALPISYLFPTLVPGRYRIETEANGFKRSMREGISLGVNQNARVDFTLEVGSLTQEVHVAADAPLVDTREAQVGSTVDRERVEALLLNGRNVYSLVSILPGVARATYTHCCRQHRQSRLANGSRVRP